jgi:RNAP2
MQTFTSEEYVQIAVANAFGLDKQNYIDRILWVQVHDRELEEFVNDADDPYGYVKAVKEYRKVQKCEPTGLIVKFDATASGAQLLSVMTGCHKGCEATNAIGDSRNNPYMMVRDKMQELCGKDIPIAYDKCKKAVMTALYGSKKTPKETFGNQIDQFWQALAYVLPGAYEVFPTMMDAWQGKAVHEWVMPDGFQVRIPTYVKKLADVMVPSLEYEMAVQYYDVCEQKKGLSMGANITHSVDAYLLRSLVRHCSYDENQVKKWILAIEKELDKREAEDFTETEIKYPDITKVNEYKSLTTGELVGLYLDLHDMLLHKSFPVVTVHDCFGCHANNMNRLRYWYNKLLARLNTSGILEDILSQLYGTEVVFGDKENLYEEILDNSYAIC